MRSVLPGGEPGTEADAARARRRRRALVSALVPYLLVLPAAVLAALFVYSMVNGVLQGFGIMPYLGLRTLTLSYYRDALTETGLLSSILFSLYIAAASAGAAVVGGVALAAAVVRLRVGRAGQILGIQIPIMTSHMIVVLFVLALLSGGGLVARLLFAVGITGSQTDIPTVAGSVHGWGIILVYVWKEVPYIAFCAVAVMGNIGDRFTEAAASLGASPLRAFFAVTLPLSAPTIIKAFLVVFAFAFGAYEVPFLLGATLPRALPVLAYVQYTRPDLESRGHAMALNGVMTAIALLLAAAYFRIALREHRRA